MRLANKVALVTGGGSGIGRAICQRFAREGAQVVAADIVEARAQETMALIQQAGGNARAVRADVSNWDEVQAMVQETLAAYGRVDILVNNAAIGSQNDILTYGPEFWDHVLAVVLKSVFLCSKAVLPNMLERRSGVIVNISSVNGLTGLGDEPYSAAKAGVINLTKNLAITYGPRGVRANAICPGTVRTPIWADRVAQDPHIFEKLAAWYPLGRVAEPEDVANAALFLASDEASFVTGEVMLVDGGLMAGSYKMAKELMAE